MSKARAQSEGERASQANGKLNNAGVKTRQGKMLLISMMKARMQHGSKG